MRKFETSRRWSRAWSAAAAVVALAGSMVVATPVAAPADTGDPTGQICDSAGSIAFGIRFGRRAIPLFDGPKCVGSRVDCPSDHCVARVIAFATAAVGQAGMKVTLQQDDCDVFSGNCGWDDLESHICASSVGILRPECKVDFVRANLTHVPSPLIGVHGWRVLCDWNTSLVFTIRPAMTCGMQMYDKPPN